MTAGGDVVEWVSATYGPNVPHHIAADDLGDYLVVGQTTGPQRSIFGARQGLGAGGSQPDPGLVFSPTLTGEKCTGNNACVYLEKVRTSLLLAQ
jgi:hypothetical protein